MTFDELQKFIDTQHRRSNATTVYTDREHILARAVKLGEEYGELCDEVLASFGDQRRGKLAKPHDLEGEFADVIIMTFMLAKIMNVNVKKALVNKIKKIKQRQRR